MLTASILASSNFAGWLVASFISFVIWVVVLIWVHHLAKRKGRHPLGWVLFAAFFSLFALILILVLPSKRTTAAATRQ